MRRCSPTFLKLTTICDVSHVISFTRPSFPLFFLNKRGRPGDEANNSSVHWKISCASKVNRSIFKTSAHKSTIMLALCSMVLTSIMPAEFAIPGRIAAMRHIRTCTCVVGIPLGCDCVGARCFAAQINNTTCCSGSVCVRLARNRRTISEWKESACTDAIFYGFAIIFQFRHAVHSISTLFAWLPARLCLYLN